MTKTTTNTQIQAVDINQIQAIGEFGVAELMAMKESIAKKLSIPQFNLFMYQMNRMGLDPSLGHGVPILYGSDVNIRIEYEGFHSLARKSPGYMSVHRQVVCDNEVDDFEAETNDEGIVTKIRHKIRFPRGKVVGSYAIARREGKPDVIVLCDQAEFEKYAKKNPGFWKLENGSLDPDMCKKHAATRAVKEQYDIALAVEENMMALNSTENSEPVRRDITAESKETEPMKTIAPDKDDKEETPIDRTKALKTQIKAKYQALGLKDKSEFDAHAAEFFKIKGDVPTEPEIIAYLKIMDQQIQAAADDLPV